MKPRPLLRLQKPRIVRKLMKGLMADLKETQDLNKTVSNIMANSALGATPPLHLDEFPRKKDDV